MTTSDSTQPEDFTSLVDTREKNHISLIIIVGVLILFLLAGYWLFAPEQQIELTPPLEQAEIDPIVRAQIEAAQQSATPEQTPKRETQVATEMASFEAAETSKPQQNVVVASLAAAVAPKSLGSEQTTLVHPGDKARTLIKAIRQGGESFTIQQLFNEAEQMQANAQDTDAYLLYFYAARQGHGPSAFELAEMNDPAYFQGESEMLDKPDPVQAHKWYSIAAVSQIAEAEERLAVLRDSVEAAASTGDPAAQRLLLNWK